ncbi:MAG: putative periplasmic ligand-binding sensor domain protein [Stygiobacter sp.]|nr:MAG: putative periplasmic ligand-binding sensor domain protein [Stygiobacter sp.]
MASRANMLLILMLLLLSNLSIIPQIKIRNFTTRNGLVSNVVHYTLKDSKGFIWFTTDDGICRYDGVRFTIFNDENKAQNGLEESIFFQIFQHSQNQLFFLSYSGQLYCYDYRSGRFSNLSKNNFALRERGLTCIVKNDADNTYWLSTERGIIHTKLNLEVIGEYLVPERGKNETVSDRVSTIYIDRNGVIWLGMLSRGILRFDCKSLKYLKNNLKDIIPKYQQVNAFYSYPNSDDVFVATGGEGLIKINTKDYTHFAWRNLAYQNNSLPSDRVTALYPQNDSILWVGTLDGLAKLNFRKNEIQRFVNNPLDQYSIQNNSINHLSIDSQNILWVCTSGGVGKLNIRPERFIKVSQNLHLQHTLSSNRVSQCYTDKYENLWVATSKGINVKKKSGERFYHYSLPKSFPQHSNEEVIKFFADGDTWWVGTWGGGISRFILPKNFTPGDSIRFNNFYNDERNKNSISSNFIRDFAADQHGNLWISTWNGGLNLIRSVDKSLEKIKFTRFTAAGNTENHIASDFIDAIVCDSSGSVWLGTSKGLQRFNYTSNTFEMIYSDNENLASPANVPTSIVLDKQNNIWFSHFSGIAKVSTSKEGKYSVEEKLNERKYGAFTMTMDKSGTLWFSTNKSAICSFVPSTNQVKLYSMTEEVDGFEFYFGEATADESGYLYFGGNSGYLTFHPDDLYVNNLISPIQFTSVKISGEELQLQTDISNVKELSLDYGQRNINVSFAALNYIHSEKNEYKYILEGIDDKWTSLANKNEITFANLPVGKYKLKVIGSNNDGLWNYKAAVISITVEPPFWQNNYFRFIILLSVFTALYFTINSKIRRLKNEKERQNLFAKLLIETQEKERKRLSHELHDSLGQNLLVIKNQVDIYQDSQTKDDSELANISQLIKESIAEVKEISSDLHPHQLERLGLSKALKALLNKISQSGIIEIVSQIDDVSGKLPIEKEINIYRIVQESFNNIIKHAEAKTAKFELTSSMHQIYICIEDNGKGFDLDEKEMEQKFREGLGLKSISERVRLLDGVLNISSGKEKGTKITITIYINK